MTKIISWDLDGVIANSVAVMVKRMNEILDAKGIVHEEIAFDTFSGWQYVIGEMEKYTGDHNLGVETDKLFFDPDFLFGSLVFSGVKEMFIQLSRLPITNVVTTSRPGPCKDKTIEWLELNGLLKYFEKVNFQTGNVVSDEFKINSIIENSATFHFDDSPKVVRALQNSWLIDRPWNKDATDLNGRRLFSWEEAVEKIEAVCQK